MLGTHGPKTKVADLGRHRHHFYGLLWNDTVAMALDELTHEFFARAAGAEIRRVKEVSACLAVSLIDLLRFSLR
jgi:hypothetical protein